MSPICAIPNLEAVTMLSPKLKQTGVSLSNLKVLFIIYLLVIFLSQILVAAEAGGDLYTDEELELLPQLLDRLEDELTNDYMFENKYLVRFLRASDLDLDDAELMLRKNLKWRHKNHIDDLFEEDFDDWAQNYPVYITDDKDGRPALVGAGFSNMNFQKMISNGLAEDALRFNYYFLERTVESLQDASNETGIEFTGATVLFNLARFNARTHACAACLPYFAQLVQDYETYYPQLGNRFILVNSPKLFEFVLKLMRPFMSSHTKEAIQVYGFNKAEWRQELMKTFPPTNLTPDYGGTLKIKKL